MKGLTDVAGIRVGHATDYEAMTGCTVILCEPGAVAGIDIRGSASGAQETDTLSPLHVTGAIHAVVLSGGSAFGLETASGVRRYLEQKGVGFATRAARVPIVPCAILYDLGVGARRRRPTREMGETAAAAATSDAVLEGCVGAGTGASVGKVFGLKQAMKGGIGSATVWLQGEFANVRVSALAAVNAFGDIRDAATNRLIAGARRAPDSRELADTAAVLKSLAPAGFGAENTTLVVVATNARLTKVLATKLAQLAQTGVARALSPAHTLFDGDVVFALSLGNERADINSLGVAAAEAAATAIARGVQTAKTLGGLPGLAG